MKLQELKINNRFEHIVDYESRDDLDPSILEALGNYEPEENFVISYEACDLKMPFISFKTRNSAQNEFTLETDLCTESCQLVKGVLSLTKENKNFVELLLTLDFSSLNHAAASTNQPESHSSIFSDKGNDNTSSYLPEIKVANNINQDVVWVGWDKSGTENMHCLMLGLDTQLVSSAKIEVCLNLTVPGFGSHYRKLSKSMVLYVALPTLIRDVVLDFGSEATQMSITQRSQPMDQASMVDLFTDLCNKYGNDANSNSDYYQYDEASDKFFKSHFFIKKSVTSEVVKKLKKNGMDVSTDTDALANGEQTTDMAIMRFLTSKHEAQQMSNDYIVAPNVKLTGFGGISMPKVMVDSISQSTDMVGGAKSYFYYRLGISVFLREALDKIANVEGHTCFLSFHILMPNIYMQSEIVEILQLLQIDIQHLLNQEKYQNILGFEVTAVSESDASMMGVSELIRSTAGMDKLENGNYLLLDAGKGTLDFSLVHYEFKNGYHTYQNRWRSGIVGAGNSLTYAYLLALIDEFLLQRCQTDTEISEDHIKQFIYQNILGLDRENNDNNTITQNPADLLNMMRAVDKYKCCTKYTATNLRNREKVNQLPLKELQLQGFLDWLESGIDIDSRRVERISDRKHYIQRMIDALVNETVERITTMQIGRDDDFQIDYIIFAGRAFKLEAFKAKMKDSLMQKYQNVKEIEFILPNINLSLKDICLVCVEPLRVGTYNRKICSLPVLLQGGTKQNPVDSSDEHKKSKGLITIIKEFFVGKKSNEPLHKTPRNQGSTQPTFVNNILTHAGLEEGQYTASLSSEQDIYVYNPKNLGLNIGGKVVPIQGVEEEYVKLLYTGKKYKIRTSKKLINCESLMNFATSAFVQSSFFPNIPIDAVHDILLVPETTQSQKEAQVQTAGADVSNKDGENTESTEKTTENSNREDDKLKTLLDKHK